MGDGEKENKSEPQATAPLLPGAEPTTKPRQQSASREETLLQARRFLQDAQVQNTTPERKVEFLKSKGLSESDIEGLLKEVSQDGRPEAQASRIKNPVKEERIEPPLAKKEDRPPIVTYPEFLTKPARPPPLVTVKGFLNTLYAFGGLSTLVYGASKYVVEPMVDALTEARISLHDTANQDLAKLVAKLESTVSKIPPLKPTAIVKTNPAADDDNETASSYDDPTELFHRDIGVQTSLPTSPHVASLTATLKSLSEDLADQTEALGDVQTVLGLVKQDVAQLEAAAVSTDFVGGGYSLYGAAGRNEPDDEIKRAKENIRRVKGVLLSTRSFPGSR
ncbi:de1e5057-1006-4277-be0b-52db4bc4e777 [Thermothielavioides terrestris]|uniref:Peroxisomal membrane protein PEX14 n=1 Tax=Thermothielavioides terrestris TaxID=2587410 RepID=A0A446BYX1_9PEZI|nr:de1e5057-1006-4277-be0b-52db4bc4e777 [Thermothielavioides terrestris]